MTENTKENVAKITGAAIGGTTAVTTVSVAGTSAGYAGGAALMHGLAVAGGAIGGGALGGVVVVAAAPIAGAAIGYGVYKGYKHFKSKKASK